MEVTFGEYIKQRRGELGFPLRKVASHIDIDRFQHLEKSKKTKDV